MNRHLKSVKLIEYLLLLIIYQCTVLHNINYYKLQYYIIIPIKYISIDLYIITNKVLKCKNNK